MVDNQSFLKGEKNLNKITKTKSSQKKTIKKIQEIIDKCIVEYCHGLFKKKQKKSETL